MGGEVGCKNKVSGVPGAYSKVPYGMSWSSFNVEGEVGEQANDTCLVLPPTSSRPKLLAHSHTD